MQALSEQIQAELGPVIEELQVTSILTFNPTPPAIDVYPALEFQDGMAYGKGNNALNFTVRARISTAEHEEQQILLLSMMDRTGGTSMAQAILSDRTLGGVVGNLNVEGPTGYQMFGQSGFELLGCTWLVRVLP